MSTTTLIRSYTTLATVIPLVVGTIITLVIVLAVIGFVLQHRRHRSAVNRVREMVRERSVLRPAAASDSGDEHLTWASVTVKTTRQVTALQLLITITNNMQLSVLENLSCK
jgi:hypothetical protein